MNIIIEPLEKALNALQHALNQPKNEFTRDATIQRFEYSFELTWKILKRYLKEEAGIDESSIRQLFREAHKQGFIHHVEPWFAYHSARNLTSHTYHEKTDEETYQVAQLFIKDAQAFLKKLREKVK